MSTSNFQVTSQDLAGKGKRFANYIIDLIIFYLLAFAFSFLIVIVLEITGGDVDNYINALDNANPLLDRLISLLLYGVYMMTIEFLFKGRSIGKFITKTQVVLKDGSKPTINETVLRNLCRLIPFDQLSFLGTEGKGWHDSLSKTYVVDIEGFEERKSMEQDLETLGTVQENYRY